MFSFPNGDNDEEAPCAEEPNGKILCLAFPQTIGITDLWELDPSNFTFASVPNPGLNSDGYFNNLINGMIDLPNGQILRQAVFRVGLRLRSVRIRRLREQC